MSSRISLWSGPRNISTALMYSFAQRSDTVVYDEPLYAHYLRVRPNTRAYHPEADQILDSQEQDGALVVNQMLGPQPAEVAFFKNMGHHLVDLELGFLSDMHNVILTRDPRDMLPSYAAVVDEPSLADVGYAAQVDLLEHLLSKGLPVTILDARRVLEHPQQVLEELCTRIGIDFEPRMLSWAPGARPEDGVWAPHWYASVHRSTGFAPYRPKPESFPVNLEALYAEAKPYYDRLLDLAL